MRPLVMSRSKRIDGRWARTATVDKAAEATTSIRVARRGIDMRRMLPDDRRCLTCNNCYIYHVMNVTDVDTSSVAAARPPAPAPALQRPRQNLAPPARARRNRAQKLR